MVDHQELIKNAEVLRFGDSVTFADLEAGKDPH
jgi:hypothetical protein